MSTYKDKQLLEDVYDLIKECTFSDNQQDGWASMSRQFANDARKGLHKFIKDKYMLWDGDKNVISIGEHITISITYK